MHGWRSRRRVEPLGRACQHGRAHIFLELPSSRRACPTALCCCQAVLIADVDLLVGGAEELGTPEGWAAMRPWLEGGAGVVLPAFETPYDVTGHLRLPHPEAVGRAAAFQAVSGASRVGQQRRCTQGTLGRPTPPTPAARHTG